MVTDNADAPTREELEAEHAEKLNEVKAAQKAVTAAEKAFQDGIARQLPLEQVNELAIAFNKAKDAVTFIEKLAVKAKERVDNFELEAKRDERNALIAGDVATVRDDVIDFEHYTNVGVEKLTLTIDMIERTVSAKPAGPGIRSTTPRAPRENGNGGFTSRGAIRTVDGREWKSVNRAYMELRSEADGTEVTPANTESASRWLRKHFNTGDEQAYTYIS